MAMSVRVTTLNGRIVHEIRHGVESFFLRDQQGSTIALAGVDGKITDTYQYWPFGEVLSHVGGSATPFTFLGTLGYFRDFLATYYVRARHLRADLARWLTVDPLWPSELPFSYVKNAPATSTDYLGLGDDCKGRLDKCLQIAEGVRENCKAIAGKALSVALAACRQLPKILQFGCFAAAINAFIAASRVCWLENVPLTADCWAIYEACLAKQCLAMVAVWLLIVAAILLICEICIPCCAAIIPIIGLPASTLVQSDAWRL